MVIQLLGWMLVWSPWGILEILSRPTASRLLGLFLSPSLRAMPRPCLSAKVIQLPGWVPGLSLGETARVRHGFFLPLRAAGSKPKGQPAGRLSVCALSLRDPLTASAIRRCRCRSQQVREASLGVSLQMCP
ncbi:uncharacterized protein M6G45_010200 [Spheniscus humboldti]